MTIQYNPDNTSQLNGSMDIGNGVELPFLAPPVWVINGDPRLRSMATIAPALFFGGWSANFDDMQHQGEEYKLEHFPAGFFEAETTSRDNTALKNLVSRAVFAAPFGVRKSWITREKQRFASFVAGSRQHVQVLAIIGSKEEGKIIPFYPVLLSAKGWQATYLEKSLSTWSAKTQSIRRKLAKVSGATDIPAWVFWSAIGTWGNEPKVEMVGSGDSKSPITPISPFIPKDLSEQLLESLFVGQDLIDEMIELKNDAQDWLNAWKALSNGAPVSAPVPVDSDEPFTVPHDIGSDSGDIPF